MNSPRIYFLRTSFILGFCFFLLLNHSNAQAGFQKIVGGSGNDYGFAGTQTSDKGFVMGGYTGSYGAGKNDLYAVKLDSAGALEWTKVYGGNQNDQAYAMEQTNDGGLILTGYSKSFGSGGYDVILIRTNSLGDTLWSRTYGGAFNDFGNAVHQTADGGFIVAGYTLSFAAAPDSGNAYLVKTDGNGNLQWTKSFGGPAKITDAYSVVQTPDKGYAVAGYTNGFGEVNGDMFLAKTDSSGNLVFMKTYGGKGEDWGNSLQRTSDGGYVILGSASTDSTGTDIDAYLVKTDANGDTLFTKIYGGTGFDFGQSVKQVAGGGYALGGYTNSYGAGNYDGFLIRTNAVGDTLFTSTYGDTDDDEINVLSLCADGGYELYGYSLPGGGTNYDFFSVHTNANGMTGCTPHHYTAHPRKVPSRIQTVVPVSYAGTTVMSMAPVRVNTGGQETDVCKGAGISEQGSGPDWLQVFPNPSEGIFTLGSNEFLQGSVSIAVSNLIGERVFQEEVQGGILLSGMTINLQVLPSGMYFLQVRSGIHREVTPILLNRR